jgi:hypothetical protein
VSLDEAYRYTYNRTLAGTAATAVGAQHPTLETDLKGRGDVTLTHPAAASSQLLIPSAIAGRIFLQHRPSETVLAELDKAAGEPVRLALPPGSYTAILRQGDEVRECAVTLAAHSVATIDLTACRASDWRPSDTKGGAGRDDTPRWGLELSLGVLASRSDTYLNQIRQFGFSEWGGDVWLGVSHSLALTGTRALGRHFALTLGLVELDTQDHHRGDASSPGVVAPARTAATRV